jgi:pyruvate dehydrogenase E2 component (dihydrolipoamide acetyltransferase)
VKEGDKISVGQVILSLGGKSASKPAQKAENTPAEDDEAASEEESGEPEDEPKEKSREGAREETDEPVPTARRSGGGAAGLEGVLAEPTANVAAAPGLRKLARELGIDLSRVQGTERGGRVGKPDVRRYIESLQRYAFESKPAATATAKPAAKAESVDFSKWGAVERKPLSQLRKVIAERMSENWTTIPHVTQFDEADITGLMALRKKHAAEFESKGAKLTLTGFAVRAVVEVLKKHHVFNSSLDEASGELVMKGYYHIGLAVDTEAGLLVPVIRDADQKNLFDISREIEALAGKARDRKLALEELKGGSFTISNQGGIGGAHFTPIVNKPEVAILGLGRGAFKAVVREKKIEPRLMLPLALSYDHRVIDGGNAARFMVDLVQALEQFSEQEMTS